MERRLINCVTHTGGVGAVYVADTRNGEVGAELIVSVVPGREAMDGVECSTRIGVRDTPCHVDLAERSDTRIASTLRKGVARLPVEAYQTFTRLPHKVTSTGPVLSIRSRPQATFTSSPSLRLRFRGDCDGSRGVTSRGWGSYYTTFPFIAHARPDLCVR